MRVLDSNEVASLKRVLRALDGAYDEFLIAGGQGARLYRFHPLARAPSWPPIVTKDIDLVSNDKPLRASVDLWTQLEKEGFRAEMEGDDRPPRTLYVWGTTELELLVPELPRRKAGNTVTWLGASAKRVKHLELLLSEPLTVSVPDVGDVRLPNPSAYIIQKLVTLPNRKDLSKRGKDALYVHDTIQLFSGPTGLPAELVEWSNHLKPKLTKKQQSLLADTCRAVTDSRTDYMKEAARQTEARGGVTAEQLVATVRIGLGELKLLD